MELFTRIHTIDKILHDNLAKKDKIIQSFKTMSGLELNRLDKTTRKTLEKHLVASNHILQQYPIVTYDDYRLISEPHLDQLLRIIQKKCDCLRKSLAMAM